MANFGNVFRETEIKKVDTHPKRITKWIHYTKMVPNKKQYRDVTEQRAREEALAMLIQADGEVLQDLIVRKIDADEYEIIAGHTRHGACRLLVEEEGKTQFEFLPCIVKDISEVRAAFQLFSSNGYSEKTQYEKMHEIEEMKHLIETYPEEFPELQKGRMVERLAKQLKIDKSTVGEYLQISNNLGDEAMQLFESGEIKKSAAVKLAGLPNEEQSELIRSGVRMATQIEVYKKQKTSVKKTEKETAIEEKKLEPPLLEQENNKDRVKAVSETLQIAEQELLKERNCLDMFSENYGKDSIMAKKAQIRVAALSMYVSSLKNTVSSSKDEIV